MVFSMKLFRRTKQKEEEEVSPEPDVNSVVKATHSSSTEEASSDGENPANKDVLDELKEKGYDPENGGRLMLLESISYEGSGDRYAMTKSVMNRVCQEPQSPDEYRDYSWDTEESSRDSGNSESSRDSTFYTIGTQKNQAATKIQDQEPAWSSPRRTTNRSDNVGSKNVIRTSWSLKSEGSSIAEGNIYHSKIVGPLPSTGSSAPSFLDRVKSTPIEVGPADPPGQFLDKYHQIDGVQSNDVSLLSMNGAEAKALAKKVSESTVSSVSNTSSSGNSSSTNSNSILSSSLSTDTTSTISDDKSQDSNNPWRWLSKPAASFRARLKKDPILEEETPQGLEYNKHRDAMKFQKAPSFVTGTFVSNVGQEEKKQKEEEDDDEGAVECMIVPDQALPDILSIMPEKNLPPTPRKRDEKEERAGFPEIHSRGQHFKAMQEYWNAIATSDGNTDIPRPPTFVDPELQSSMTMEDAILMKAMSMGSMDVIPVPRNSRKPLLSPFWTSDKEKPVEVAFKPKKKAKEEKLDFIVQAESKEKGVEVAMEPKRSRLSKLKSKLTSTSSTSGSRTSNRKIKSFFHKKKSCFEGVVEEEDENMVGELKRFFEKNRKKLKDFEGVLEEADMVEEQEVELVEPSGDSAEEDKTKQYTEQVAKPDPIAPKQRAILKSFGGPRSPKNSAPPTVSMGDQYSHQSLSTHQSFDVPRNVMIHPDLGQDTMEEELMADELVGFVKLMPIALMSFFKENPNEDELIRSLQPTGRSFISERKASSVSTKGVGKQEMHSFISEVSESSGEDVQKQMNFLELTPSVVGDLPEDDEEESERTEKRRGGILRKLVRKKGGSKTSNIGNLKTPRMSREAIEEMAAKEVKQKVEEGVELIAGVTRQGQKAIVISNTKRHPNPNPNPEQVYHA